MPSPLIVVEPWMLAAAVTLILGLGVLVFGYLHDRRRHRAASLRAHRAPERPGLTGSPQPRYLTGEEARRPAQRSLPDDAERARVDARLTDGCELELPLPDPALAADPVRGRTALAEPRVLVTDAEITEARSILTALERSASSGGSLVIVAADFSADVLAMLEVNVIRGLLRVVALRADAQTRAVVCDLTGAEVLTGADLQAGFLPIQALGRAELWVADARRSTVLTASGVAASGVAASGVAASGMPASGQPSEDDEVDQP